METKVTSVVIAPNRLGTTPELLDELTIEDGVVTPMDLIGVETSGTPKPKRTTILSIMTPNKSRMIIK